MPSPHDSDDGSEATARPLEEVNALKATPAVEAAVSATLAGDAEATELETYLSKDSALADAMAFADQDATD